MANFKIRRTANKLIQITNGNVSQSAITHYLEQIGVEVVEIDSSALNVVNEIGALSFFLKYSAVTYESRNGFVILLNRNMPTYDKFWALIREIGHIMPEHSTTDKLLGRSEGEQKEADRFVKPVQKSATIQKRRV